MAAKRTLDPKTRAKIEDLVAHNHHNEAAVLLCEALDHDWIGYEMKKIMWDASRLGYTPHEHIDRRYKLMKPLWDAVGM